MNYLKTFITCIIICSGITLSNYSNANFIISYNKDYPQLNFASKIFEKALQTQQRSLNYQSFDVNAKLPDLLVVVEQNQTAPIPYQNFVVKNDPSIVKEGFKIFRHEEGFITILAKDATGAMYGILDIAEQIKNKGNLKTSLQTKQINPHQKVRAIKFNLPWSSYRSGQMMELHKTTCRDLDFWEKFLNMMAKNRFNTLSLWNLHPFHYMIRVQNYPEATPFSDQELQEWKNFWRSLFKMAHDRGIETYIVNWNIVVPEAFANNYNAQRWNDTSAVVKKYKRESITQVINEYKNLDGFGVTLADWMDGMTPSQREDWINDTFIKGIKNADRPVKFIHRSVLAGSAEKMRALINKADLPDPVKVTVKFNWSHGHSTPQLALTHARTSGKIDEGFWKPFPEDYKIQWTVRNEDFFILRWGAPDFIRSHIHINNYDYTSGYFIGSEGYIPAKDYVQKYSPYETWQYSFQRQWLFYKMWGRLLYNPETPDQVFAEALKEKFSLSNGQKMLEAYQLASQVPLRIASFHQGTWDYTLYSEGFLAPYASGHQHDQQSEFIDIREFINHKTLDPEYLNIPDYVEVHLNEANIPDKKITPLELADKSENDSRKVLNYVNELRNEVDAYSGSLPLELDDLATWAHLGLYFGEKLRAGVALEKYRQTGDENFQQKAVHLLETCLVHWQNVVDITEKNYRQIPYIDAGRFSEIKEGDFSWKLYLPEVKRDIEMARTAFPE